MLARLPGLKPREFAAEERELAEVIPSLSALVSESSRLYERLHRNYLAALEFNQREFD
jgi:hypothetical protein